MATRRPAWEIEMGRQQPNIRWYVNGTCMSTEGETTPWKAAVRVLKFGADTNVTVEVRCEIGVMYAAITVSRHPPNYLFVPRPDETPEQLYARVIQDRLEKMATDLMHQYPYQR